LLKELLLELPSADQSLPLLVKSSNPIAKGQLREIEEAQSQKQTLSALTYPEPREYFGDSSTKHPNAL